MSSFREFYVLNRGLMVLIFYQGLYILFCVCVLFFYLTLGVNGCLRNTFLENF